MKKLLSAVLSLLMLAALSVPGFAEEALIVEEPAGTARAARPSAP